MPGLQPVMLPRSSGTFEEWGPVGGCQLTRAMYLKGCWDPFPSCLLSLLPRDHAVNSFLYHRLKAIGPHYHGPKPLRP